MAEPKPLWQKVLDLARSHRRAASASALQLPDPRTGGTLACTSTTRSITTHQISRAFGLSEQRITSTAWVMTAEQTEWVRHATHDGHALAIRRAQDARRGKGSIGISPIVDPKPPEGSKPRDHGGPPAGPSVRGRPAATSSEGERPAFERRPTLTTPFATDPSLRQQSTPAPVKPRPRHTSPSGPPPAWRACMIEVRRRRGDVVVVDSSDDDVVLNPSPPSTPAERAFARAPTPEPPLEPLLLTFQPPPPDAPAPAPAAAHESPARRSPRLLSVPLRQPPPTPPVKAPSVPAGSATSPSIPAGNDTFYQGGLTFDINLAAAGPCPVVARRQGLPPGTPVPCVSYPTSSSTTAYKGMGSKHANRCAGPWASALSRMPPAPISGARRVAHGLGSTPITADEFTAIEAERAARALVAILPWGCAAVILQDSPEAITARDPEDVTERLVRNLSSMGVSSLTGAASTLGRLLTFALDRGGPGTAVSGSMVTDFYTTYPPSAMVITSVAWLRDWCGIALPARGAVPRPFKGAPPVNENDKESMTPHILVQLEHLAATSESPFVRGHAAAWFTAAKLAQRHVGAVNCVINAFVAHPFEGGTFTVLVGAVRRDKHPNPSKRRPRPFWGCIEGIHHGSAVADALRAMLVGVEDLRFLLRETDSKSGCLSSATTWLAAPLMGKNRVDASLHHLLSLPPLRMPLEHAQRFHGHSAKRFMLNLVDNSPEFNEIDASNIGRFAGSTAQNTDLEPTAALLQRHTLRASVLPGIYAAKSKVSKAFDLLARVEREFLRRARAIPRDAPFSSASLAW
jgi:hypothetical protein